jgi:predicted nucleic acid-binding protein
MWCRIVVKDDTRAAAYAPLLEGQRLAISFMTVAELFEWIAATALRHSLPLITHNPSDFQHITSLDVRSTIKP